MIHTGGQLDRALQLRLLQAIASSYPHKHFLGLLPWEGADEADAYANLHYLCAHGLIEGIVDWDNNGRLYMAEVFVATKDGMDFLADDGGLRAILGTVTVKLHQDTLRQLIEARIASSDLDPADKRRWSDALRELPAESIKHLTTKLIDMALDTAPGALPLLARFLGM